MNASAALLLLDVAAEELRGAAISAAALTSAPVAAGAAPLTPFGATALLAAVAAVLCWVASLATGYWSYVDRLWSLVPAAYALLFALWPGAGARVQLICALICIWAARLTFNFARKGGYGSEEDYRWPVLRAWFKSNDPLHPLGQEIFNLAFVAVYQHALIWAFTALPLFVAWHVPAVPFTPADAALAGAFLVALAAETHTDEVQWRFQRAKHALNPAQRAGAGGDVARGFCSKGPFRVSRHLNFCCEQAMWWLVYALGAARPTGAWLHWSATGAALLTALFQGSTWMTELLTRQRYPAYAAYQRTTSRLLPWLPGPDLDSPEGARLVVAALEAAGKKVA
jgi:steroid 5-alpha reductase family enzyme